MPTQVYKLTGLMARKRDKYPRDVQEAVTDAMNGSTDSYSGELERMRERMDNHARFVGELVQKLHEAGALDIEALGYLLGSDFEVVTVLAE